MNKLEKDTMVNIGIIVNNIEETAKQYNQLFDLAEEVTVGYPNPDKAPKKGAYKKYHGELTNPTLKSCFVNLDPIYLEILEPANDEPSPWKDYLEKHGPGVCFITFHVDGFEQSIDFMEQGGFPMTFVAEKVSERFAYFDTQEKLGFLLELKEPTTREL